MAASRRSTRAVAIAVPPRGRRTLRRRLPRRPCSARLPSYGRQRMIPASDLLDDSVRVGGPDERPRVAVVLVDVAVDRLLQRHQRGEAAAPEPAPCQLGEEGL